MKKKRDFQIGIKTTDEFFEEAQAIAGKLHFGWRPENRSSASISTT